ncbi:MAG: hypothetical protein ABIH50_01395 [bacterium]
MGMDIPSSMPVSYVATNPVKVSSSMSATAPSKERIESEVKRYINELRGEGPRDKMLACNKLYRFVYFNKIPPELMDEVASVLLKTLDDDNVDIRRSAMFTIRHMDLTSISPAMQNKMVGPLIASLRDKDSSIGRFAQSVLRDLSKLNVSPENKKTIDELFKYGNLIEFNISECKDWIMFGRFGWVKWCFKASTETACN